MNQPLQFTSTLLAEHKALINDTNPSEVEAFNHRNHATGHVGPH